MATRWHPIIEMEVTMNRETDRQRQQEQRHTGHGVDHTDGQQNTGNHKKPDAPEKGGPDRFGGTRAGAANLERKQD
jgi:hypothetical protein